MNEIGSLILAFVVVYIIYLILVVFNKKARRKLKSGVESKFLKSVYKVNVEKISDKKYANIISINNSLIIAVAFYLSGLTFKNIIFQIIISFPILILCLMIVYTITGKCLKKYE